MLSRIAGGWYHIENDAATRRARGHSRFNGLMGRHHPCPAIRERIALGRLPRADSARPTPK